MRVVEPRQFKNLPKPKKKRKGVLRFFITLVVVAGIAGGGFYAYATGLIQQSDSATVTNREQEEAPTDTVPAEQAETAFKIFSGDEFKQLYLDIHHPNTKQIENPPPISGNKEADERIRLIAERRGYRLSNIPMASIVRINEPRLDDDDLLQPLAAEAWNSLKTAAHNDGYPVSLLSAYRPPEYQRDLFMERLLAHGVTIEQIAAGRADSAIEQTLTITAVPGYSRHHTGYTIDLWCEDGSVAFVYSRCYEWISANNYLHAKEHGWIPSYPEGADMQGPEPEPWEYVWVGKDSLTE